MDINPNDVFVVKCDSLTGANFRTLRKGNAYPASAFVNLGEHLAQGDVVDKTALDAKAEESDLAKKIEEEESQLAKDKLAAQNTETE